MNYGKSTRENISRGPATMQRFQHLKLWTRIILICGIWMAVVGLLMTIWVAWEQRRIALAQSDGFSKSVQHLTLAGLTTLMVTGQMQNREIFLEHIRNSRSVQSLRVLRGQNVIHQFGSGTNAETPSDEIERAVLESGQEYSRIEEADGDEVLRIVRPIRNEQVYLGKSCVGCHQAPAGAVLGAVSMRIPLEAVNQATFQFSLELFLIGFLIFLVVMAGIFYFVRLYITVPLDEALSVMRKTEAGDLTGSIAPQRMDEIGLLLQGVNHMNTKLAGMIRKMYESSMHTEAIAAQLARQAGEFADSAGTLAAAAEESSAAVEELSATGNTVADAARETARGMQEMTSGINLLGESIAGIKTATEQLTRQADGLHTEAGVGVETAGRASQAMDRIQELAGRITDITGLISDISDKTNLLALNAAIEAARAGDAGRGFAVVADEITRLADRTMHSVREINLLINETGSAVNHGHSLVKDSTQALYTIREGINGIKRSAGEVLDGIQVQAANTMKMNKNATHVAHMAGDIENSTAEQRASADEINRTVQSVANEASGVSDASRQLSTLSRVLVRYAEELRKLAEQFKVD